MNISPEVPYVNVGSVDLRLCPFIHMTGHREMWFYLLQRLEI